MYSHSEITDKLHEECAVFGVSVTTDEAAGIIYNGLLAMQHRGQEGAGIAAVNGSTITVVKNKGLVNEVFTPKIMSTVPKSSLAIGHARYSTTGSDKVCNVQPFMTEYLTGRIATAHNGNIINAAELKAQLEKKGLDFTATSDSEVISSLIAYELLRADGDVIAGFRSACGKLIGAFSLICALSSGKLVAVRDPNGFRPLCIGKNEFGYAVASESCALDSCGFELVRNVLPGEIVIIENGEIRESAVALTASRRSLCVFEFIYFARPDSVIDGLSVYEARFNMGRELAKEYHVEADAVCGVPDSGLEAAAGYAAESGIPLVSGFVKNRYIGRSFIYPTQKQRENAVSLKLNPLRANVSGKRIVIVDDSIVRGTTGAKIVSALRDAGAKEIHMRISAPPFRHTCHFGTDIDSEDKLIANKLTVEEIGKHLGVDSLGFISVDGLLKACAGSQVDFCTGCFTGDYSVKFGEYSKFNLESGKENK